MYQMIRKHPTTRQIYADRLACEGAGERGRSRRDGGAVSRGLDEGKSQARASLGLIGNQYTVDWRRYRRRGLVRSVRTAVELTQLRALGERIAAVPEGFTLHPRVAQVICESRARCWAANCRSTGAAPRRWPMPRLLEDGFPIRLVGQDSGRGTFFHRHAVLHDQDSGETLHAAAARRASGQPRFAVIDSVLSEEAVLGFEYGYSTTDPDTLVDLGRPVRRFRQRRAGGHRPVHQLGRSQVGPAVRPDAVPAARLRRAGPGAFLGAPRALPAAVRREQHAGVRAVDAGADVPHAAPADAALVAQAADRDDAEEPAAPRAVGVVAGGTDRRPLRARSSTRSTTCAAGAGAARRVLQRQGVLRPARARGALRACAMWRWCASSSCIRSRPRSTRRSCALSANAREIVWCQEEPQNQGAWYQIRHRLQEPLQSRQAQLLYAGRAPAAAPATGIRQDARRRSSSELVDAALACHCHSKTRAGETAASASTIAIRKSS